jgi:hypothetical protein
LATGFVGQSTESKSHFVMREIKNNSDLAIRTHEHIISVNRYATEGLVKSKMPYQSEGTRQQWRDKLIYFHLVVVEFVS